MDELIEPPVFEAVIVPHRSLSRRGLRILVTVLVAICSINATVFVSIGAWPVGGFTGVELLLAAVLLRINVIGARASEVVILTGSELRIRRTDAKGRRTERTLPAAWLRLHLEERPGRVSRLVLAARGGREEIGASLGEEEKRDLAVSLGEALERQRHPRFDNPQLRDG